MAEVSDTEEVEDEQPKTFTYRLKTAMVILSVVLVMAFFAVLTSMPELVQAMNGH